MEKIASFTINHDTLVPGIYLSRVDGDIVTYDLRFVKPNRPPFIDQPSLHTIEHLFATILRNGEKKEHIVYFGPMGCRTGFYLLTTGLTHAQVIDELKKCAKAAASWDEKIPGATARECGNYLEHDLDGAKKWVGDWLEVIKDWDEEKIKYPE